MIFRQLDENLISIKPGVLVSRPRVDSIALSWQPQLLYGLQECTIGISAVNTQFNKHFRARYIDQPEGKGSVRLPRRRRDMPVRRLNDERATESRWKRWKMNFHLLLTWIPSNAVMRLRNGGQRWVRTCREIEQAGDRPIAIILAADNLGGMTPSALSR